MPRRRCGRVSPGARGPARAGDACRRPLLADGGVESSRGTRRRGRVERGGRTLPLSSPWRRLGRLKARCKLYSLRHDIRYTRWMWRLGRRVVDAVAASAWRGLPLAPFRRWVCTFKAAVGGTEKVHVGRALDLTGGSKNPAARLLKIDIKTLNSQDQGLRPRRVAKKKGAAEATPHTNKC